jgi:flagellar basal-body rod protein FlgB
VKLGNAFGIHEQALLVRSQRNELLASNIANADTPNYKSRDLDFREVLKKQSVQPVTLKATHAGHIQPSQGSVSPQYIKYRTVAQPSLDGNTVNVEQELVRFSENSAQFEATMRFLTGKIQGIEKAIKGS